MDLNVGLSGALSPQISTYAAKATKLIVDFLNNTHATQAVSGKTIKVVKFTTPVTDFIENSIFEHRAKEETVWNNIFNQAQVSDIIDTLMKNDYLSKLNVQSFVIMARILLLSEDCLALEQGLFRMMDTLRSKPQGRKGDTSAAYGFKLQAGQGLVWILVEYLSKSKPLRLKRWALCILNELCLGCQPVQSQLVSDKKGQLCLSTTGPEFGRDAIAQIYLISIWSMIVHHTDTATLKRITDVVWEGFNNEQLCVLESFRIDSSESIEPLTETWFRHMTEWLRVTGCCQDVDSGISPVIWLPQIMSLDNTLLSSPEDGIYILSICSGYLSVYAYDTASQNSRFIDIPYENVVSSVHLVESQGSPFTELKLSLEDFIEGFTYLDNLEEVETRGTLSLFFRTEELDFLQESIGTVCRNIDTPPRSSMPGGVPYVFMHNNTTEIQIQRRRGEVTRNMTSSPTNRSQVSSALTPNHEPGSIFEDHSCNRTVHSYEVSSKTQGQSNLEPAKPDHQKAKIQGVAPKSIATSMIELEIPDRRSSVVGKMKGKLRDRIIGEGDKSPVRKMQKKSGKRQEPTYEQPKVDAKITTTTKTRDEFDFQCTDDEDDDVVAPTKSKGKSKASATKTLDDKKLTKAASKKPTTSKPKSTDLTQFHGKISASMTTRVIAPKGKKGSTKKGSKILSHEDNSNRLLQVSNKKPKTNKEPSRRSGRRVAAQKADKRISDVVELERQDTQVVIPDELDNVNDTDDEHEVSDKENRDSIDTAEMKRKRGGQFNPQYVRIDICLHELKYEAGRPKEQVVEKKNVKHDFFSHTTKSVSPERDISKSDEDESSLVQLKIQTTTINKADDTHFKLTDEVKTVEGVNNEQPEITQKVNEGQHDGDQVVAQAKNSKKNHISRRKFEITESGSPVSSLHPDCEFEDNKNTSSSINSPSNLSPKFELHENSSPRIIREIIKNDDINSSGNTRKRSGSPLEKLNEIAEELVHEQDWHDGIVKLANDDHFEEVARYKIDDRLSTDKMISECNIVVEQVARISPQSMPSVRSTHFAMEDFARPAIEVRQINVQEKAHFSHPHSTIPSVPAQQDRLSSRFIKPNSEEAKSELVLATVSAPKPGLGTRMVERLIDSHKSNDVRSVVGRERLPGKGFQPGIPKPRSTHDEPQVTDTHELPPYPISRLWEVVDDDDPDKTLVPSSDNEVGRAEENGTFVIESPAIAKKKASELDKVSDTVKDQKLPMFDVNVPTSISQVMIRIMDYHTQLLMRPQEKASLMLDNYRDKGKEVCKKFCEDHERESVASQHEICNLEVKYKAAINKGYDDVCDVETKMASAEIKAKVQEQDAHMDKLMQSAMIRFGTA